MRSKNNFCSLLILFFILIFNLNSFAQLANTPWPMFQNNHQHTGGSPYAGPEQPELKWIYNAPNNDPFALTSVSIGIDGTLYIPSYRDWNWELLAINPEGYLKWNISIPQRSYGAPTINEDGTIYYSCSYGGVTALNANGTPKWVYNEPNMRISTGILIDANGSIYFGTEDPPSFTTGQLYALNGDGSKKWSVEVGRVTGSSPCIGIDGTIYVGSVSTNKLWAINPNSTVKWSYLLNDYINYPAIVGPDGTIYIASHGQKLYAITPSGNLKWTCDIGIIDSHPAPAIAEDGTIYIGCSNKKLYAIYQNGNIKWTFITGGKIETSPIVDKNGIIYCGSNDGNLYALRPDGTEKWRYYIGSTDFRCSPSIDSDGTMYIPTFNGQILAIEDAGSEIPDVTPPTIYVTVDPDVLWPPNHKMLNISATIEVTDDKDPNPDVMLLSITSNEPDDAPGGGDGKTTNDIQNANYEADDREFKLRAERAGNGSGRIYTITYQATDESDNSATTSVTVTVPPNMGNSKNWGGNNSFFESNALLPNYPNPFNPKTEITYQLIELADITLKIYNTLGQEIRTLVDKNQLAGTHKIRWDGRDNFNVPVNSGYYFIVLKAGNFIETRKALLLK
jgi:outer membrane protein assembly factor BamB